MTEADRPDDELPLARPPKMSDVLADRLRARILGKNMQPGDLLSSETELIATFGVARGTVREALRLLESDGLIEIRRGRQGGIVVRRPDLTTISRSSAVWLAMNGTTMRELLEFRMLIEPASAAAAAERADEEHRGWLADLVERDTGRGLGHSVEFHEALAVCSGNALFRVATEAMRQELEWHAQDEHFDADQLAASHRAHQAIATAVVAGDPERARRAMNRHLNDLVAALAMRGRLDEPIVPAQRWIERS
jgi:DNA-binding FadR family transcriptional regulator